MIIKKILNIDEEHSNHCEKKYIFSFCLVSFIVILLINFLLRYHGMVSIAIYKIEFYNSLVGGVMFLCMLPFLLAYLMGRLLSGLAYLFNDDRSYSTQYNLLWLLFIFLTYFYGQSSLRINHELTTLTNQCQNVSSNKKSCKSKAVDAFSLLKSCGVGDYASKVQCINDTLQKVFKS